MSDLSNNPLWNNEGLPLFDQIKPEHVVPATRAVIAQTEKALIELEKNLSPTWDGLMKAQEALWAPFGNVWGPICHMLSVQNSDELRKAYEEVQQEVVKIGLRAGQSKPIYQGLIALKNGSEWAKLDYGQQRAVELQIRSAEHSGIALEGDNLARFNEISEEVSKINTDFSNAVLDSSKAFELIITDSADIAGWPESFKALGAQSYSQANDGAEATSKAGPWRVSLDFPSYGPFMKHSQNRLQREKVYRAFISRASSGDFDNTPRMAQIVSLYNEEANLLGYDTYAELSLACKMAPNVAAVEQMTNELYEAALPFGKQDLADLQKFAAENGCDHDLKHWDISFWSERQREQLFNYTDDELRPYFPLPKVLDGLFGLCKRLFGIRIEQADGDAPVWHKDVMYFNVYDEEEKHIANFYLDSFSRPAEKSGGAWMNICQNRMWVGDKLRIPTVYLICNQTPPVGDKPSLMSFYEVETLYHEFGHGLQAMLTTVDHTDVAGINGVDWDSVELASQFMENWCYHKPTLLAMTAHIDTGEQLPVELFDKICAAKNYRSGSAMLRQLAFGETDMYLYHYYNPEKDGSIYDVQYRFSKKSSAMEPMKEDRFLASFSHIFCGGYSAGYYSYKWSEVLSADAFAAFEEGGLDSEKTSAELGRKYRDTVLALGGSKAPMEVFKEFRGREPKTDALLRHSGLR